MAQPQIGYLALERGTINCACKGLNLIVMNNPVEMKTFVQKHFKIKHPELRKVYGSEVIDGLKLGGHYLLNEKAYKNFLTECIDNYPQLFPPNRLVVTEPVVNHMFFQVSWDSYKYNTPKELINTTITKLKEIKLNKEQFKDFNDDDQFQLFCDDEGFPNFNNFDEEVDKLFQKYDYVYVTENDCIYGERNAKREELSDRATQAYEIAQETAQK